LLDLDDVDNDAATAAAFIPPLWAAAGEEGETLCHGRVGATISQWGRGLQPYPPISGAISGLIEAMRQKMSEANGANGAHAKALAGAEVHAEPLAADETVYRGVSKENRGELSRVSGASRRAIQLSSSPRSPLQTLLHTIS
jgi:hypothetical protein